MFKKLVATLRSVAVYDKTTGVKIRNRAPSEYVYLTYDVPGLYDPDQDQPTEADAEAEARRILDEYLLRHGALCIVRTFNAQQKVWSASKPRTVLDRQGSVADAQRMAAEYKIETPKRVVRASTPEAKAARELEKVRAALRLMSPEMLAQLGLSREMPEPETADVPDVANDGAVDA